MSDELFGGEVFKFSKEELEAYKQLIFDMLMDYTFEWTRHLLSDEEKKLTVKDVMDFIKLWMKTHMKDSEYE